MKGFVNPFARKNPSDVSHTARIKDWVRTQLRLPEDVVVSVNEVACRDAGCPDIETVIGILQAGRPVQTLRVIQPIAHVTKDHIALAIHAAQRTADASPQIENVVGSDDDCCEKTP